ncbi:hypothetical protein DFP73DRAFT_636674 [Morchella snyderi]|nr:hypothetical protein DFP73DRAFT_636674 [Morchella snyderi]
MGSDYRCTVCWSPATDLCGRCKQVRYCGTGCQRDDWKTHKVFCGADAFPAKNPTVKSYRALFFPVDEGEARFLEVSFERRRWDQQESEVTVPTVDALLGNRSTRTLTRAGIENKERELVHGQLALHLASYMEMTDDGTPPNLSLRRFMGLGVENDLKGPVVISKRKKINRGRDAEDEHMDMELDDLRDAVQFLKYQMILAGTQKKVMGNFNLWDFLADGAP